MSEGKDHGGWRHRRRRTGVWLSAWLAAALIVQFGETRAQAQAQERGIGRAQAEEAEAEPRLGFSLAHYERTMQRQDKTATKMLYWYLDGVLTGLAWSFADHRARRQPLFFCLPESLEMTVEEIQASIAAELEARGEFWRRTPDIPVERVALYGLKRRFPCPSQ